MRVQAGFHVSFKLLHCLLLLDSVQFSSSCCSATVLCLILQSPLMLISFF